MSDWYSIRNAQPARGVFVRCRLDNGCEATLAWVNGSWVDLYGWAYPESAVEYWRPLTQVKQEARRGI
jgi:hypothetical protein